MALYIINIVGVILILSLIRWLYVRNRIVLDDEIILSFLSSTQWKSCRRMIKEIRSHYRGKWFSYADVYITIARLREDGFVEHRRRHVDLYGEIIPLDEFIKKSGGGGRKRRTKFFEKTAPLIFQTT